VKEWDRKYRRGKRGKPLSTPSRIPSYSFSAIGSAPIQSSLISHRNTVYFVITCCFDNFQLVHPKNSIRKDKKL
jgi:hypothetical protein